MPALQAFSPRLARHWLHDAPQQRVQESQGTLVFVDISGFTALTERLTKRGKVGAEQLTDVLNVTFERMLQSAYAEGADLLKWGGDAMLLFFDGHDHAIRACRAARGMRERLEQRSSADRRGEEERRHATTRRRAPDRAADHGRRDETRRRSARRAPDGSDLQMSVGVHSGTFTYVLAGDDSDHRELLMVGPDVTRTVQMESTAQPGEIVVSDATARLLPAAELSGPKGDGMLLGDGPMCLDDYRVADEPDGTLLVPADVRHHLQQAAGESEHRRTAIAFIKFSGTDALLAELGPERLATELDRLVRAVQSAATANGVTFLASDLDADGGKFLLAAGAPINRGAVEERMLRTARVICDDSYAFAVKAGVNTGPVFAGDFGPPFRRTYTILGDSVNLAARLMTKASPGQVVASTAVLHACRARFQLSPLEPFAVKGKSSLIQASLVGALEEDGQAEAADAAEMVGRARELQAIADAASRAKTGSGTAIAATSGAGMGLSRLQREAVERTGLPVHRTAGDPYQQATAYARFRPLLRSFLGLPRDSRGEHAAELMVQVIRKRAPDLEPWVPLYALVLDVPSHSTPEVDALADEFRRDKLESVTVELVGRLLKDPCLIAIDDVHLLDEASQSLVGAIERAVPTHPWVLLLTGRSGDTWQSRLQDAALTFELAPLSTEESTALVRQLLRDRPLPPADVSTIVQRGEGSPAFLVSLVRAALAGESLDQLPDSVEAMVAHQIDELPPTHRTLLRYASVLGLTVRLDELVELVAGKPVAEALDALPDLGFFLARETGDRYRFTRALVRDTAYEGLPYSIRKRLHARAAAVIEGRVEDPVTVCEVLSVHYAKAGMSRKAWDYSIASAKRAEGKSAYAEAEVFYQRALSVRARQSTIGPRERGEALKGLSRAQDRVGRLADAVETLRKARRCYRGDVVEIATLMAAEGSIDIESGNYASAARVARTGLRLAANCDTPPGRAATSRLLLVLASLNINRGRFRVAEQHASDGLEYATNSDDLIALAYAEKIVSTCLAGMGSDDTSHAMEALRLFSELGDPLHQAVVVNNLAWIAWSRGLGRDAISEYQRAAVLAAQAGDSLMWAQATCNEGDISIRLGLSQQGIRLLGEAEETFMALGADQWVATCQRGLALGYALQGDIDEGLRLIKLAEDRQLDMDEQDELTESMIFHGHILLLAGDPNRALLRTGEALARARLADADYLVAPALRIKAAALVDMGEFATAMSLLLEALDVSSGAVHERGFIHWELRAVAVAEKRLDAAAREAQRARAAWKSLGYAPAGRYTNE